VLRKVTDLKITNNEQRNIVKMCVEYTECTQSIRVGLSAIRQHIQWFYTKSSGLCAMVVVSEYNGSISRSY